MSSKFMDYLHDKYGEDFFKEEIRSDFLVTVDRKALWAVMLDLLEQFASVCERHGLKYYLICGSLLGAVRHKGFIPWDDDMDVAMPREDYDRLAEYMDEFRYPYFLQTPTTDKGYCCSYMKLRNSETALISQNWVREDHNINMGILIDIFPLDRISENNVSNMREQMFPMVMKCSAYMKHDSLKLFEKDYDVIKQWYDPTINPETLYDEIQRLARSGENDLKADYLSINVLTVYDEKRLLWPACYFGEPCKMKFENLEVNVPEYYDKVLQINYGNYMEFPPVEKRGAWHSTAIILPDVPYKKAVWEWIRKQELQ